MRYLQRLESVDVRGRRYATVGLGNAVGRGRSVMFIVTVLLGLLGYMAPSNSVRVAHRQLVGQQPPKVGGTMPVASPLAPSPSSYVVWPAESMNQLVSRHGGALSDQRATVVRAVGQRLAAVMVTPGALRFDVLADSQTPGAYVLHSGNVLLTAAMVDRLANQDELAGALARQLEALVRARGQTQADSAEQLMRSAGYSLAALDTFDSRLADWRTTYQARNVLASHVEAIR